MSQKSWWRRSCSWWLQNQFGADPDTATTEIYTLSLHDALPILDDDPDSQALTAFILEQYGANVTTAASAAAALTALAQLSPHLLLSDIGMSDIDGYSLLRQIRSLTPEQNGQIPAIALTSYASQADQQQAIAVGFHQHLSKPVEPEVLVAAIMQLVVPKPVWG